ncbi:MAG: PHP domain-containing protein, partial [Actinomycetes bacterium]
MLDGAARLGGLFAEVSRLDMPAIAMTDHGYLYGAYEFYNKAKASGVKPIVGLEAYVAPESRFVKRKVSWSTSNGANDDEVTGGGAYTHMTLLAADEVGLHNLFRLASYASLEGFYRKPRIDRELLSRFSTGIIGTTGCPGGEIPTRLRGGDYDGARAVAGELRDILGPGNLYIEVMDHGIDVELRYLSDLLKLGKELGLASLATNDLHYTHKEDAHGHDVLLCVQTASTLADPKRFKFDGGGYYVKTAEEMRALWADRHGMPEACDNTLLVAERIGSYASVFEPRNLMPAFEVPAGETEESWLRKEVDAGLT